MFSKYLFIPVVSALFVTFVARAQAPAPTVPPLNSDYSAGTVKGKPVYIAETHQVTVETNKQYQTQAGIPPCEFEIKDDPKIVQHAGEALAGLIIKAATSGAGVPWLAVFAGPLVGPAGKAAQDFVNQSGGDIKKVMVQTGLTKESAACGSYLIVVPQGSKIVSIDGFTDRSGFKDGKITKTGNGPTSRCQANPPVDGLHFQACVMSGWKYAESGPVVSAVLMDWSKDENVDGNLQVAFIPPPEWAKKHPRHHPKP